MKPRNRRIRRGSILTAAVLVLLATVLAACGDDSDDASSDAGSDSAAASEATADVVRLGYFPNITHAPALIGVAEGTFTEALGDTKLEVSTFNAGPEAVEALFADALDITYIGPNPAINAYAKSDGEAVRIVGGSTSGGAYFVVKPEINSAQDLKGKKVASPQLGNTQDVALRTWLKDEGLNTDTAGGGDVSITPQENSQTLTLFKTGDIAGAWVPEPWATRLVQEGGGKVLVDEKTLWPEGQYVTTHVIVRTKFLDEFPGTVKAILEGNLAAIAAIEADPAKAATEANAEIGKLTGKPLPDAVIDAAWKNLSFTSDPIASSLETSAKNAEAVDLLDPVDLGDIYSLDILNDLLKADGQDEVSGL